ncbi:MAG: DoxX family membrane protein [Candidatus Aminicenantes bacterium]|nr:DoxX family membrane protein [Candidatus Aminicenantes bacterium]MDH5705075.1 DoxX family membrane protein [Candidatus Aminicenantes bacterium]
MATKKTKMKPGQVKDYTTVQLAALVSLRVLIGWHFLYEGIVKVINPYWSSAGFMLETKGIFKGLATSIVASPDTLGFIDFLNKWGLILIGLGLIAGCLTRVASIAGMALLFLYYVFHPPFIGYSFVTPVEGSYLLVDKNLIELCALFVLNFFPTGMHIGLDRLIFIKKKPA